ncbi:hypothetical protein [Haloferula sargassicola]|uniref:Uncharacterized protein n=1 Tax=Haloferula sargassicola TaxID=490096 RepID=A0ABP9UK16_9BACT
MRPRTLALAGLLGLLLVTIGFRVSSARRPPREAVDKDYPATVPVPPGQHLRSDLSAEDVFRRAFWRHPAEDDKILHGVRLEWEDREGVRQWAWFLEIHPGSELLGTLIDSSRFGLLPTNKPREWLPEGIDAPTWFRPASQDMRIFQHPSQRLTLFYRRSDNLLFATDHGLGFALAAP